jgi:hypothetical protein
LRAVGLRPGSRSCIPPQGQAGAQNSQSPVDAGQDGDGNQHALPAPGPLFDIDQFLKKSNATGEFSNFDAATVADRKLLHVIWLCMAKIGQILVQPPLRRRVAVPVERLIVRRHHHALGVEMVVETLRAEFAPDA